MVVPDVLIFAFSLLKLYLRKIESHFEAGVDLFTSCSGARKLESHRPAHTYSIFFPPFIQPEIFDSPSNNLVELPCNLTL